MSTHARHLKLKLAAALAAAPLAAPPGPAGPDGWLPVKGQATNPRPPGGAARGPAGARP